MGQVFKTKTGFEIRVKGIDYVLPSIYTRLRWQRKLNGNQIEIQGNIYVSKEKYLEDEDAVINVEIVDKITNKKIEIPGIANYGFVDIPENYDQNDLSLCESKLIQSFENVMEISN